MSKLQKQIRQREKAIKEQERKNPVGNNRSGDKNTPKRTVEIRTKDTKKTIEIPTYNSKGKAITPEKTRRRKKAAVAIGISTGILAFLYVPQVFMHDREAPTDLGFDVEVNHEAIRNSNSILRENSLEDFDGDGVLNADESAVGTDPWRIDTDNDGVTDYAELHITNTSPTEYTEVLMDVQMKLDKTEEKSLANPYSIGNVILWPDSYESKAYGSVIETSDGAYRFCDYSGSVLFPDSTGKYAYSDENGIHTLLDHDLTDNTWIVKDGNKVSLYDKELEEVIEFNLFGFRFFSDRNSFTTCLNAVLPRKGFISARRMTKEAIVSEDTILVSNEVRKPLFKESEYSRLMNNMTTISSLGSVRTAIDDGKCVAVSMYNSNQGEYLGIVYGYTSEGNLLLADMEDKEKTDIICITEKARKMLNEEGEIVSVLYFDWSVHGFSSENNDRISFFATSNVISATEGGSR